MKVTRETGVLLPNANMTSPVYFDVKNAPFKLYGFCEPYRRVPADVAAATSANVAHLCKNTTGGRVCFKTDSPYIVVHADYEKPEFFPNNSPAATAGFDIFFKESDGYKFRGVIFPNMDTNAELIEGRARYGDNEMKDVVIFFPICSSVKNVYIGLAEGSELDEGSGYKYKKPIVFYGSSIVHGGGSRAGSPYSAVLSRRYDTDYINLGFGGSALAESAIIDHIASLDMSVFVYDYDHNSPNEEHLEKTHYAGYKRFREKQPMTPVIMASLVNFTTRAHNSEYFTLEEHKKRREIVKASYERAVAEGDENVYFIDGSTIFPKEVKDDCTCDGLHPNDLGYYFMANAFGAVIEKLLK